MKQTKKAIGLCLALVFLLALLPAGARAAEIVDSGYCGGEGDGTNLTWTLDSDGVLTISGTGDMKNCYLAYGMPWEKYKLQIQEVRIEYGATSIGEDGFFGCDSLQNIIIPSSVTRIEQYAFDGCSNLTDIFYQGAEDQWQLISIPRFGNRILNNITIHYNTYISQEPTESAKTDTQFLPSASASEIVASGECGAEGDNLTWTLDSDGVLTISGVGKMKEYDEYDSGAPWRDYQGRVSRVHIGKGVSLVSNIFGPGFKVMTEYTVEEENPNYKAVEGVLFTADMTVLIAYPTGIESYSYSVPSGVENIYYEAFYGQPYLEELIIPDGVRFIGYGAFLKCPNLRRITMPPSVESIVQGAFSGCSSLQTITIPDGVEKLGTYTFYDCKSLQSITIPASMTAIEFGVFYDCSSLHDVYYYGSRDQWSKISIDTWNDPLLTATVHFMTEETNHVDLPQAARYVPYREMLPHSGNDSYYYLISGSLPSGLSLSANGFVTGMPTELGNFTFEVYEASDTGIVTHRCTIMVFTQYSVDVEVYNRPGFGFVETATDNGRIQDQVVSSREELRDQVMHCEGDFYSFAGLYLDAKKLTRDVDYTAEEGSTRITVAAETLGEAGGGTHTVAAEFKTFIGESVYTVQNYTVTGIASKEVHVTVEGEPVLWTDAEPYIDTNNRTMTPFRAVGEALGLSVAWDSSTREASFTDGAKTIYFPIGSTEARGSDGSTVTMDTSAVIINGRTYAPIRYLAEFFGRRVSWDGKTRTAAIGR